MKREMTYVLDDVLDIKYGCDRYEKQEIIEALLSGCVITDKSEVHLVECLVFNQTMVSINREQKQDIRRFLCWNFFDNVHECRVMTVNKVVRV